MFCIDRFWDEHALPIRSENDEYRFSFMYYRRFIRAVLTLFCVTLNGCCHVVVVHINTTLYNVSCSLSNTISYSLTLSSTYFLV